MLRRFLLRFSSNPISPNAAANFRRPNPVSPSPPQTPPPPPPPPPPPFTSPNAAANFTRPNPVSPSPTQTPTQAPPPPFTSPNAANNFHRPNQQAGAPLLPPIGENLHSVFAWALSYNERRHDDYNYKPGNVDGSYHKWIPVTDNIRRFVLHGVRDSVRFNLNKLRPGKRYKYPDPAEIQRFKNRMKGYEQKGLICLEYMKYIWPNLGRTTYDEGGYYVFWLMECKSHAPNCGLTEEQYFPLGVQTYDLTVAMSPTFGMAVSTKIFCATLKQMESDMVFLSLHKLRKCGTVILVEVAVRTNKYGQIFRQKPDFRGYNGYFFVIPK